jgi:hypothetical protein
MGLIKIPKLRRASHWFWEILGPALDAYFYYAGMSPKDHILLGQVALQNNGTKCPSMNDAPK